MTATMTRTAFAPLPTRAVAAQPLSGRLRVTRRGRLVLVLLAVALLFVGVSIGRAGSQAATVRETGPALEQVTVQPGETLWGVAQRIAPDNDPREVVSQIRRLNNLHGSTLQAGQQLLLPTPAR
jgi:hypothetical protein